MLAGITPDELAAAEEGYRSARQEKARAMDRWLALH
jgi:hypothetical protein